MKCKFTKEMIEDLSNAKGMDYSNEERLNQYLQKDVTIIDYFKLYQNFNLKHNYPSLDFSESVFNELDPYGEENWEVD